MMRHLLPLLVLLSCAAVSAQTSATSPPGFESKESIGAAMYFGGWSDCRVMHFDGELRNRAMTLKEIAFRADDMSYSSFYAAARSWTNVSIQMSNCDLNRLSWTFSKNPISTPTRVFNSALTFPLHSGYPPSKPAKWSIRFPFSTAWKYAGTTDLCLDFDFRGGRMANAAPWSAGKSYYYALDGYGYSRLGEFVHYSSGGCRDSAATSTYKASFTLKASTYNGAYSYPEYRNKHLVYFYARHVAPWALVVHAVGLGGIVKGLALPGVSCNHLYVDPQKPIAWFSRIASSNGSTLQVSPSGHRDDLFPYNSALVGVKLWGQAGWPDSKYGNLLLTDALQTSIPARPPVYKKLSLLMTDPKFKGAFGVLTADPDHFPVVRYSE